MALVVIPVACLKDNYAYLLFSEAGEGECVIVDACESAPIEAELCKRGLRPSAILTTHHHWDHIGGNVELSDRYQIPVFGFEAEQGRIPALSVPLEDGQSFECANMVGKAHHLPGHTQGALLYRFGDIAFTGDTLFVGGCGRLREGTATQLHYSLSRIAQDLPPHIQLYTGHEYAEANLRFATSLVQWPEVERRYEQVRRERAQGRYCASSDLRTEQKTNLFLNCHRKDLQEAVWGHDAEERAASHAAPELALETFARLRELKDAF